MSRQAHPIRFVNQWLSATEPDQLPDIIQELSKNLGRCGDVLSSEERTGKDGSDLSVQVHKLKTRISSLLQSKHHASKWASIILIKTAVETGGLEVLRNSRSWVHGLLGLLGV